MLLVGGQHDTGATSVHATPQQGGVAPHHGALGPAGDRAAHPARNQPPGRPGYPAEPLAVDSVRVFRCGRSDAYPRPHHTTPPGKTKAAAALKACRAKVQAADKVMAAGRNGMRHWSQHVQAQTDAFAGRITIKKMDDIFDRTMKAGDEDEARYTEAIKDHEHLDGSCGAVGGAPAEISSQLARCAKRGRAQRLVLAAAADGMADWTKHLGDMRRSKQGKIHNPQKKWLKTWRAAPPHIKAHKKAVSRFSAPEC